MHMFYWSWDKSRPSVSHGSLWPHCHSSALLWTAPYPPERPGALYHPSDQKSLSTRTAEAGHIPAALQCHFIPSKMEDLTGMLHHCWTRKSHPQTSQKLHEKYSWWEFVIGKTETNKGQPRSLVRVLLGSPCFLRLQAWLFNCDPSQEPAEEISTPSDGLNNSLPKPS